MHFSDDIALGHDHWPLRQEGEAMIEQADPVNLSHADGRCISFRLVLVAFHEVTH